MAHREVETFIPVEIGEFESSFSATLQLILPSTHANSATG